MPRGGVALEWIKPLLPDGTREPGVMGCYRGGFSGWNLRNPKPGYTFRLVNKKRITERTYQGYIIARPEHAQLAGDPNPYDDVSRTRRIPGALLETEGMVMMLAPIDRIKELEDQRLKRTKDLVEGIVAGYQDKATGAEQVLGRTARKPLRFDEGTGPDTPGRAD